MNWLPRTRMLFIAALLAALSCVTKAPPAPESIKRDADAWILREYLIPCVPRDLSIAIRHARFDEDIDAASSVYLTFGRAEIDRLAVLEETPADPRRHPNTVFHPSIAFALTPHAIERLREDFIARAREEFRGHSRYDITMNGSTRGLGSCASLQTRPPANATVGIECPVFETTFDALADWVDDWVRCASQ